MALHYLKNMLYAIQQVDYDDKVKLGISIHPPQRVKDFQTGNPDQLEILAVLRGIYNDQELESEMKWRLQNYIIIGGGTEWFYTGGKVDNIICFMIERCIDGPESLQEFMDILRA